MNEKFDVIVVGGGSSGLMAALSSAQQGAKTLLIEKNRQLGRKLLLTGGGRCNVTNRTSRENLIAHIPGNGKFLYGALNQFDQEDIITFFQEAGVSLKEEDHGRMFPVSDRSRTILDTLIKLVEQAGVQVSLANPVATILYEWDSSISEVSGKVIGLKTEAGEKIEAPCIILTTGGLAYPATGATGDGYAWAKTAGHQIEKLYPTEAPLLSNDPFIKNQTLKGLPLRDVDVTVWDGNIGDKAIVNHRMDMIFTHFGFSGPAILRCSGHVNQYLDQQNQEICHLSIDLLPDMNLNDFTQETELLRDKEVKTILKQWIPERLVDYLIRLLDIDSHSLYKQLVHQEVQDLYQLLKFFPLTAYGSQPIEKGFVTGGGVSTKEVNPKTMESKLMRGLFFAGEILDINGYTGGYNITAAFVTGTVSGQNAAWQSFSQE